MKRTLAPLPYPKDALEPYVTGLTVEVHYERHQRGYLTKLLELVDGKPEQDESLETLIRDASGEIFQNAAQVWNHEFSWRSLTTGGSQPGSELLAAIQRDFGSLAELERRLVQAADAHFGSGWLWLALDSRHRLRVATTHDADNPLRLGATPLLGVDLWEHAYYLDYFNERRHYVENVVRHLFHWDFAAENFRDAPVPVEVARSEEAPALDERGWSSSRRREPEREKAEPVYEVPIRRAL